MKMGRRNHMRNRHSVPAQCPASSRRKVETLRPHARSGAGGTDRRRPRISRNRPPQIRGNVRRTGAGECSVLEAGIASGRLVSGSGKE